MDSLFQQVQAGKLWPLTGGVHPPAHKSVTSSQPIGQLPIPNTLILPIKQHIGAAGKLLVKAGDQVLKGQPLSMPVQGLSLPVHAPTSGVISHIALHPVAHPSGLSEPCIFIDCDGKDQWIARQPLVHYTDQTSQYLLNRLQMAGLGGLGGAGFPTYMKSAALRKINYLIINATECEPYISADDSLIQRSAESIIQGIDVIAKLVNPDIILIGIENDKPEAIRHLRMATEHRHDIHIREFPAIYPSGGEKQLIHILTGMQVPSGGLPIDIGVLVHNIGTAYAIYKAVLCDEPLISRIVTVTGGAVKSPQNLEVLLGTPIKALLEHCDFEPQAQQRVIMGGPMMGFTLNSTDMAVVKTTNCILAPAGDELSSSDDEMECIRCGACADVCPVTLLPQQLLWYSKSKEHDKAEQYNLKDCIECGACAYVCPSEIPLVHYYRVAKAEIKAQQQEKQLAEHAKLRFEARTARLERDALERQEKQRLATEKRKQALAKSDGKDTVAAALARVKAKKLAQAQALQNATATAPAPPTAEPAPEQQPASAPQDPKKAAIARAVAKAKAKDTATKQARAADDETQTGEQQP